nr:heavy metal sensor histidine kinase [Pseudomonas sp. A29(2023)]
MMRLSLGARLSLLFAAATASVSLIAGALFDRASEAHFLELDNQLLASRAEALRSLLGPVGSAEALAAREDDLHAELQRQPDLALRILGPQGELWFDSQAAVAHAQHGETAWRAYGTELLPGQADSPRLDLRLDITHHQHFLERMQRLIWLTVGLSALATALLGAWAVRSGLRPLRQMAEVAAGISAHSLTTRLDPASVPAELSDLVSAFNAMLARLEDAFQRLSAFSGDIAHELRTPLSNLLTQTQVTLAQPRDLATYREAMHSNLEELQHLAQMVNDMLFLAKAEHGLLTTRREPLVLADELEALAEFFAPLAEEGGIRLTCSGSGRLEGDRAMLRRALSNLLDNALRFTPAGGAIELSAHPAGHSLRLEVANQGPAIPAELQPRLFDRFFRADPARREGQAEHAGLGLAITRSIVRAHSGEVRCVSADGWTRFQMDFPVTTTTASQN